AERRRAHPLHSPVRGGRQLGRRGRARREGSGPDARLHRRRARRRGRARAATGGSDAMTTELQRLTGLGLPDARGRSGEVGGCFVPEILVGALARLARAVAELLPEAGFQAELVQQSRAWIGRATPLTPAPQLSERYGAELFLKREDLAHTGAHKI